MNEVRSQPLFVLEAELRKPQMVAQTPLGERKIVTVAGGTFEGTRLQGTILPGGADWALIRNDGSLQLDVRLTLQTNDGAAIFMTYRGIRHGSEAVLARLAKGSRLIRASIIFASRRFLRPALRNMRGSITSFVSATESAWRRVRDIRFMKFFS